MMLISKKSSFVIVTILLFLSHQTTAQQVTKYNDHEPIHAFAALQIPISSIIDPFTKNILQQIDTTYGASGMNLDPITVQHIKNTYAYLIFLTKHHLATTNIKYSAYKKEYAQLLTSNSQSLPYLPTPEFVSSPAWNNVIITSQDIVNSPAYQLYMKAMISDIYAYFANGLQIIHNVEKQEFNYIPHFETSYYNQDYTNLRTLNTIVRTKIILEGHVKDRLLKQCTDWKTLTSVQNTNTTQATSIEQAIVMFRKTNFYQYTHNPHSLLGVQNTVNAQEPITHEQVLSTPSIASPLKEYVFCYFMLYELYGQLTMHMTSANLWSTLNIATNSKLAVSLFPYQLSDYILLDELLSAKSKAEGTHTNSVHPAHSTFNPEDLRQAHDMINPTRTPTDQYLAQKYTQPSVQAQGFLSFFSGLGSDIEHDVSSAWDDIKKGAEAAWDGIKDTAEAVGYGLAGFGCKLIFWDKSIVAEGNEFNKKAQHDLSQAGIDLQNSINDFSNSIKDGIIAPVGELTGDLVGFITQDKKMGTDISQVIDTTADAIVQAVGEETAQMTGGAILQGIEGTQDLVKVTEDVTTLIVSSAEVIFTGGKYGKNTFLEQWHDTLHDCLTSITSAYTNDMRMIKANIAAVMKAIGTIINSITTLFIDLSREITFIFTALYDSTIGGIYDAVTHQKYSPIQAATATANHVYSVLNAHRGAINQTMAVVVSVAADAVVDVVTGGAGTAADAEMDAMIMGAAQTASETAAESAQAAQEAVSIAADNVQDLSANVAKLESQGENEEAVQAAKQALQDAQKQLETATQKAQELGQKAAQEQDRSAALQEVSEGVEKNAQTWSKRVKEVAQKKLESTLKNIKDLPQSLLKTGTNIFKSNDGLIEAASEELSSKQAVLQDAQSAFQDARQKLLDAVDSGNDDAIATAKQELKEATDSVKSAKSDVEKAEKALQNAKETKSITGIKRFTKYGKNAFKVLKPLGFVMNFAFNFTSIVSGYNQDQNNLLTQNHQNNTLMTMWQANMQTKLSTVQTNFAYLEETQLKQQAAVGNRVLGMALYQNYNYAFINQYRQNILQALAPIYILQLMPNPSTGMIPGNIATLWGMTSNYLDLYPSQGFYTSTTGRPDFPFAQEIAQAPRIETPQKNVVVDKQWFNQRCIAIDGYTANMQPKQPNDPLSVKVNLQFLYTLSSEFHVGLYLGGQFSNYFSTGFVAGLLNTTPNNISSAFYNLQQAINARSSTIAYLNPDVIKLNEPYLAKMLVLYRNSANDPIKLGLYEHMGQQPWLLDIELPITAQLDSSHTYTLQATLNNNQINIALFVDDQPTPLVQKIVPVTPLKNQRMYGIISSGAAIMWNQITPEPKLVINKTARPNTSQTSEQQREISNKVIMHDAMNPSFGNIVLTPISKQAILFNQFMYATNRTDLAKSDPKNPTDFVIFATNQNGTISNLGKAPNSTTDQATNVIVSLITGHVLNNRGEIIKILPNVWNNYKTSPYGPFSTNLNNYITQEQKNIIKMLTKIKFGSFKLDAVSAQALQNNAYIYQCIQTIYNASNKPVIDYVIFTSAPTQAGTNMQIGLAPSDPKAAAIMSLVSGNIYSKTTSLQPNIAPRPLYTYGVFSQFADYVGSNNIGLETYNAIKQAQITYVQMQAQQTAPKTYQIPSIAPLPMGNIGALQNSATMATKPATSLTLPPESFIFHPPLNLANRQRQAAGAVPFQFNAPTKA